MLGNTYVDLQCRKGSAHKTRKIFYSTTVVNNRNTLYLAKVNTEKARMQIVGFVPQLHTWREQSHSL